MELPDEIKAIAERIRTQDNRMTADPLFIVQQKVRDYGYDPEYSDRTVWVGSEGECDPDEEGATETAYQDRWEFVTACFTEQACKDYIATNSHRHKGELRIYADSAYRNREMQVLRDFLRTRC